MRFDLQEVLQIERDVNSQIYARDFMLIDQADMIISFIPAGPDGKALISSGVERELQHAHEAAEADGVGNGALHPVFERYGDVVVVGAAGVREAAERK